MKIKAVTRLLYMGKDKYITGIGFDYKYVKPTNSIEVLLQNTRDNFSTHILFAKAMHEILRFHVGRKKADELWQANPTRLS